MSQIDCPNCHKLIQADSTFCMHCGSIIMQEEKSQFPCPECKSLIPKGSHFCPNCGTKILKNVTLTVCSYCRSNILEDNAKCSQCGYQKEFLTLVPDNNLVQCINCKRLIVKASEKCDYCGFKIIPQKEVEAEKDTWQIALFIIILATIGLLTFLSIKRQPNTVITDQSIVNTTQKPSQYSKPSEPKQLEYPKPSEPQQLEYPKPSEPVDVQILKINTTFIISRETPLMPEFKPSDPMEALTKMKYLPIGSKITILTIKLDDNTTWYQVEVLDNRSISIGNGWINSVALIGQDIHILNNNSQTNELRKAEAKSITSSKNAQRFLSTQQAIVDVDFSTDNRYDKIYLTFDFDRKLITLSNPEKDLLLTFNIISTYKENGTMVGDTQNMSVKSTDDPKVKRFYFSTDLGGYIFMENKDGKTTTFGGLSRL